MAIENKVYSIAVHLDSGVTLNGYVYQGNAIDDGLWLTFSKTEDMGNSMSVSREKIQYFEITGVIKSEDVSGSDIGRQGDDVSLRRCGHHKFSAGNYAGRNVSQLRQLNTECTEEYLINRDREWYGDQMRLIEAAIQIAYKQGRY